MVVTRSGTRTSEGDKIKHHGSGWQGEYRRHSLARKGVKTASGKGKVCDVANPMNTRSNKELLFGHSLTHTKNYQKSVGVENARCEHDRLVAKMKERGMEHKSPFKSKLKASGLKYSELSPQAKKHARKWTPTNRLKTVEFDEKGVEIY